MSNIRSLVGVDADVRALSDRPTIQMDGVLVFVYLQLLDLMTTLVGFKIGLVELSPFVRLLMEVGPVAGVSLSKVVALVLGGVCIGLGKRRIILWINYWFALLVVWNLALILNLD